MQKISLKNVGFGYPGNRKKVLKNFNFVFHSNHTYFITGNSGSGKSTLLSCLYGLYDIQKGSIRRDGKKLFGPAFNLVPGHTFMRFIDQRNMLHQNQTVFENLSFYLGEFSIKEKKQRVSELLEICNLQGISKKQVHQLSGGQQERLSVAMHLALEPEWLLMDEPFSNIQQSLKRELYAWVLDLKQKLGFGLIIVSHETRDVLQFADEILFLQGGEILQHCSPKEIYLKPANKDIAAFFSVCNFLNDEELKTDFQISKTQGTYFLRREDLKLSTKLNVKFILKSVVFQGERCELSLLSEAGNYYLVFCGKNEFIPKLETLIGLEIVGNIQEISS